MESKKKPRPVSPATQIKRRKAVQGLIAGKQVQDALMDAGYAESTAKKNPGEILKGLQLEFAEALEGMLPREAMIATLIDGLGATKSTYVYNAKLGVTEEFKQPDFFQRVKCAELLSKLGQLITKREKVEVETGADLLLKALAGRRRVEMAMRAEKALPPAEPDVTVEASPVKGGNNPE